MGTFAKHALNIEKSNKGVWLPFDDEIELLIARANNPEYNSYMRKHGRFIKQGIKSQVSDEKKLLKLLKEATARHILLDWRGVSDEKGNKLKCSVKEIEKIFFNPKLEMVYEFVSEASNDMSLFQDQNEVDEEEGKKAVAKN